MRNVHPALFALATCLPVFVACGGDAKKLSADKVGDLSYVLEDRVRPDQERAAGCGNGAPTAEAPSVLRRRPYLQQVTATSALVLLRTTASDAVVDVTRPDGSLVVSVAAVRELTPDWQDGAWQGVAKIDALEPSTLYCYEIRGLTQRAGFKTAPEPGSGERVNLIAFGDSGDGSSTQYEVKRQMFTVPFDLALHTGDLAYEHGTRSELETNFFRVYADLLGEFPFFPIAGNHDHETSHAAPFREAFALPENGGPDGLEAWYSFDWGDIHFAGVDTERMGATQAAWLDRDLAESDRLWKIVFAHKPPYSSGRHGSYSAFRAHFGGVLQKHGVRLVLNGHDHHYERTVDMSGTTYVVTGGGGKSTSAVGWSNFTAFSEDVLHFVQIEIGADELLLHAIDGTGVEFDSARITRTL